MRNWHTLGVMLIWFAIGCHSGQQADTAATAPPGQSQESGDPLDRKHTYSPGSEPKVGSKVILPDEVLLVDLYRNVEGCRRAQELVKANKVSSPEWEENDRNRIHEVLSSGDLVEVLEIGPDYAGIIYLKDRFGESKDIHGYIRRWW